jgi:peptidoglycan/LPS O-acetylase OafA/YrhL
MASCVRWWPTVWRRRAADKKPGFGCQASGPQSCSDRSISTVIGIALHGFEAGSALRAGLMGGLGTTTSGCHIPGWLAGRRRGYGRQVHTLVRDYFPVEAAYRRMAARSPACISFSGPSNCPDDRDHLRMCVTNATRSPRPDRSKMGELDAVRGLAALVVFNEHFFSSVMPAVEDAMRSTPLFALLNGGSAVMLFFVLSGFVLTLQPLRDGRPFRLVGPALRRWPRLAGPVVMAGLLYIVAARTGAFPRAALIERATHHFPQLLLWGRFSGNDQVWSVLYEAGLGTFLNGSATHNPVLWTMIWELRGSYIAFAIALCVLARIPAGLKCAIIACLAATAGYVSPWFLTFPTGVAAAYCHVRFGARLLLPVSTALVIVFLAVFVMSWDIKQGQGAWAWTAHMPWRGRLYLWAALQSFAALGVMAAAMYCVPIRQALNTAAGRFIGAMSFPLYLTHMLTILSFGAWVCYAVFPMGVDLGRTLVLYSLVLAACFLVAWPVMMFDRWWVRYLARVTQHASRYFRTGQRL